MKRSGGNRPGDGKLASMALYHHERYDYYECLGCGEAIEMPYMAVLAQNKPKEAIKANPENRLRWVELMEADHAKCAEFKDAQKAQDARTYRKPQCPNRPPHPTSGRIATASLAGGGLRGLR